MDRKIALAIVVSGVAIAGCISGSPGFAEVAKSHPQVDAFLEEHPNADMSVVLWRSDRLQGESDAISQTCYPSLRTDRDHYRVQITGQGDNITAWIEADSREVVCVNRKTGSDLTNRNQTDGSDSEHSSETEAEVSSLQCDDPIKLEITEKEFSGDSVLVTVKNTGGLRLPNVSIILLSNGEKVKTVDNSYVGPLHAGASWSIKVTSAEAAPDSVRAKAVECPVGSNQNENHCPYANIQILDASFDGSSVTVAVANTGDRDLTNVSVTALSGSRTLDVTGDRYIDPLNVGQTKSTQLTSSGAYPDAVKVKSQNCPVSATMWK